MVENGESVIPNYHYATDSLQLWNALYKFCDDIFSFSYPHWDREKKHEITTWCSYLEEKFKFSSTTHTDVLTMTIFMAAVQHSAVNYRQDHYFGYVKNAPGAIYGVDFNEINDFNVIDTEATGPIWKLQRTIVQMLSFPPADEETLYNSMKKYVLGLKYMEEKQYGCEFIAALDLISDNISKRCQDMNGSDR